MAKSCIVIGGKGFVGSAVVNTARKRGYDVLAVDLDNRDETKGANAEFLINANGNSKKFLGKKDPCLEFDLSVRTVMHSLQDYNYKHYIHLSTMDVYPEKSNPKRNCETEKINHDCLAPYGLHKHLAEQLVQYYANGWLIFRMAGFVGNGLCKNSIYDMLKGHPLFVHPDSTYQYINTLALSDCIFDIIEQNIVNEIFNIAGQGTISLNQVAHWTGYDLSLCKQNLPIDHCHLNTEKISQLISLPYTEETIQQFIHNVRNGKETLK